MYERASDIACHPSVDDLSASMRYAGFRERSWRRWTWREETVGKVER